MAKHSFISEDDKSFQVHDGNGSFLVAKSGVGKDTQEKIRGLPKYADGGEVTDQERSAKRFGITKEQLAAMEQFHLPEEQRSISSVPGAEAITPPVSPEGGGSFIDNFVNSMNSSAGKAASYISPSVNSANSVAAAESAKAFPKEVIQPPAEPARDISAETMPIAVPVPVPVPPPATPQQAAMVGEFDKASKQKIDAINAEAAATSALAKEQEGIYGSLYSQKQQEQQQARLIELQEKEKALDAENERLFKASMENKIDPNRAWNSRSTGNKILAAFGIMLSGAGSGGRADNNAAMRVIQGAIDNDIKAQMEDSQNTRSLYSMNMQKYRDNLAAQQATQLQLNAMAQGQLAALTAKYNSPIAQARAKGLIADFQQDQMVKKAELMKTLATIQQTQGGDPVLAKIALLPKQYQDAAVKELAEYDKIKASLAAVPGILKKSYEGAGVSSRIFSPIESARKRETAMAELVPVAKSILGEAMQEADVRRMVEPYLADMFSGQLSEKKFMKSSDGLMNTLRAKAASATPILSRSGIISKADVSAPPETKTVGGVTYMRGPNGEAIRVK